MMLYNYQYLGDSTVKNSYGINGELSAPSIDIISEILSKNLHTKDIVTEIKNVFYKVEMNSEHNSATIYLCMTTSRTTITLCSCIISAVEYNCGVLHLANVKTFVQRSSLGSIFMREIICWARRAGYTLILCNTAGRYQNIAAGSFFRNLGFKPFGRKYKNKRSGNTNVWLAYHV